MRFRKSRRRCYTSPILANAPASKWHYLERPAKKLMPCCQIWQPVLMPSRRNMMHLAGCLIRRSHKPHNDANIKLEQASQQLKTTFAPYVVAATQDLALFVAQVEHLIAQPMSFLEPLKFPMPAQPKTPDNAPQVTPKAPSEQEEIAALGMIDAQAERALGSHQRTHDGAEGAGRCGQRWGTPRARLLQPRLIADIKKQLEAVNKHQRRSSRTIPDGRRNSTSN